MTGERKNCEARPVSARGKTAGVTPTSLLLQEDDVGQPYIFRGASDYDFPRGRPEK